MLGSLPVRIEPGRMIGESLRLSRLLGRGAMGSVWVAEHTGLRSQVAVKFRAQAMLDDPVSLMRFQQEATAAAEIRSPHVVRVFDHGTTEDGVPYIVMELLEGESLDQRIRRQGGLELSEAASVVRQVSRALAKAHERGIFHRDIKPANIFLATDDELFVKVVDFGVAKFSGPEALEMTAQGNMVGTPAYMSPEQLFHGRSVDHRGDLWSLGVVAYQVITGTRPFDGLTLGELCVAIKRGTFVPASTLRRGVSSELDAWFDKAFARDIAERFQTARELSAALDAATGQVSTSTPSLAGPGAVPATFPGGIAVTTPTSTAGVRRAAMVGALAAVAVSVAAVVGLIGRSEPRTGSPPVVALTSLSEASAPPDGAPAATAEEPAVLDAAASAVPVSASVTPQTRQPAPPASVSAAPTRPAPPVGGATSGGPGESDERSLRAAEQLGI